MASFLIMSAFQSLRAWFCYISSLHRKLRLFTDCAKVRANLYFPCIFYEINFSMPYLDLKVLYNPSKIHLVSNLHRSPYTFVLLYFLKVYILIYSLSTIFTLNRWFTEYISPSFNLTKLMPLIPKQHFLDLNLSIYIGTVSTKVYDKRDDFDFDIVNFTFIDGDCPRRSSYGVYIYISTY